MPPRLVITRQLPTPVEARAERDFEAQLSHEDVVLTASKIAALCQGADALLPCVADKLDADLINALPSTVKIIANFGVGTDHIDLTAAKARDITVTNTPGVLTDATADLTLLLILAASRRATEGTALLREGNWQGWGPTQLMGRGLQNRRLGILGMGRIGQAVAARATAFGMEIHYHNRKRLDGINEAGATYHATVESLARHSDILSLHCAATVDTKNILNADILKLLPTGAIVINTARGDLVDDDALIATLKNKSIAAAGLDVFKGEPQIDPRYATFSNVFMLPHLGSATMETRCAMGMLALDNLDAFFDGATLPNLVL